MDLARRHVIVSVTSVVHDNECSLLFFYAGVLSVFAYGYEITVSTLKGTQGGMERRVLNISLRCLEIYEWVRQQIKVSVDIERIAKLMLFRIQSVT